MCRSVWTRSEFIGCYVRAIWGTRITREVGGVLATEAVPVTRPAARRVGSLMPRYALEHKQDVVLVLAVGHGVIDFPARLSIAPQAL